MRWFQPSGMRRDSGFQAVMNVALRASQTPEQHVGHATADADIDALRAVDRVTIGAQQAWRDRPGWRGMHQGRKSTPPDNIDS